MLAATRRRIGPELRSGFVTAFRSSARRHSWQNPIFSGPAPPFPPPKSSSVEQTVHLIATYDHFKRQKPQRWGGHCVVSDWTLQSGRAVTIRTTDLNEAGLPK